MVRGILHGNCCLRVKRGSLAVSTLSRGAAVEHLHDRDRERYPTHVPLLRSTFHDRQATRNSHSNAYFDGFSVQSAGPLLLAIPFAQ